jgi:hypothetical protein
MIQKVPNYEKTFTKLSSSSIFFEPSGRAFTIEFATVAALLQATHFQTTQIRNYDNTCYNRNYK